MRAFAPSAWILSTILVLSAGPAPAADLVWEVENPFRFFKRPSAFGIHERAFQAVRGRSGTLPNDVVWRTERRLNDPDCKDRSSPTACAGTAGRHYERTRLGWAAQTLHSVCYNRAARPFGYPAVCEREYSWGKAKEDYVLPDAHTVAVALAPERLAEAGDGACVWTWQPRRAGGRAETVTQPCKNKLVIRRVPFALDRNASGVSVSVKLADGRELTDPAVVVEDLFIVALGDSFASGESNPDRPVSFSAIRQMVYDPLLAREEDQMARARTKPQNNYGLASIGDGVNPKALPKRLLEDEERELIYRPTSREFLAAFEKRNAQWLSADCHRSQYGYPFRVGIQLALEDRHRAVTLVSLACSGAEIVEGLFLGRDPREGASQPNGKTVRSEFDQLSDLICRNGAAGRTLGATYRVPVYKSGSSQIGLRDIPQRWCAPENRKRPIDVVLLSIGGNDVGFGALALYGITEGAGDVAPVASLIGREIRFGTNVTGAYLDVLDERMKAVRDALRDGFGVDPSRVLHNAYEPIQFDERGQVCGAVPKLGLDVHPNFAFNPARIQEGSQFGDALQKRLQCISAHRAGCPAGLATGAGTGFRFVTDHTAEFAKRGMCARDPKRTVLDQVAMTMPRKTGEDFEPYSPAHALPYGARWRLIHTPNDAFLTANTHREGISPFDILQPAYASLYSGAFHPTAEGHAIVADHVVRHVRKLIDRPAEAGGAERRASR